MAEEVSVRALELPFRYLRGKGIPIEPLLEGLGTPVRLFTDKSKRIDWTAFVELNRRIAAAIGGAQNLPLIGRSLLSTAVWRPLKFILRAIASQRTVYRWVAEGGQRLMFSNLETTVEDLPNGLRLRASHSSSYEISEEYFLITKGVLEATPGLLGYPFASVTMQRLGLATVYEVVLPRQRRFRDRLFGLLQRLRLNPAAAAAEIEKSYQLLEREHHELQASNLTVERQAKQIRTVEELGRVLIREVEPQRIAEAMRDILQNRVGFQSVAYFAYSPETKHLQQAVSTFEGELLSTGDLARMSTEAARSRLIEQLPSLSLEALSSAEGQFLGLLACLPRTEGTVDLELFQQLLPHFTIAAKHSLAYTTIQELNRNLERRVAKRTADLSAAQTELLATITRLEEAMAARDRLFANLNHEFRTPITLMLLPLEKLLEAPQLAPYRSKLEAMENNARKLLRLVDGLLELAASREGRLRLRLEKVDVSVLAKETMRSYLPAAEAVRLSVTLDAPEPAVVFGSSEGIGRILDNLLSNAFKYTPAGGSISVQVESLGDTVSLKVRDTGIGVPLKDRERIFERFERSGDPVTPGTTGTGIGLALVKELAAWHGGAIAVTGEPGEGSTFQVTLPCLPTPEVLARQDLRETRPGLAATQRRQDELRLDLGPTASGLTTTYRPETTVPSEAPRDAPLLLVVEDHPDLRAHVLEMLGHDFRVLSAENGQQALEIIGKQPVDLVLSDLVMPGIDGLELCKRVKTNPSLNFMPFILLTALHDRDTLIRGLDQGADDFLVKPFNEGELMARVRAQLRIRDLARKLAETSKLAATGAILSGMAHELRNPVNVLVNGIEPLRDSILAQGPLSDDVKALLEAIDDAGRRVNELTNELLAFHRPAEDAGQRVHVPDLIDQSLALLRPKLGQMEIQRDIAFDGDVLGSVHGLSQVVVNLVENAFHAVNGKGNIGIQTRAGPDLVELDVWDDGPGISAENREKIFEPFFTTKAAGVGTGLGLAISRKIAERHGGRLNVQPSSRGARFRLTLPRATPEPTRI